MGQKYAAYDASGTLAGFYDSVDSPVPDGVSVVEITDAEWLTAIQTGAIGYTVVGGALTPPAAKTDAELLADAQATQKSTLYASCAAAIVDGFTSDALGTSHNYPSAVTDQQNQNSVANSTAGGLLWCETGDVWSFSQHTQAQAQTVVSDFAVWLNACQSQLVTLSASVAAATTVAAVQAIVWANPS
ncbi:hypothetical protein ABLT15_26630 [Paraburkholderia tropica]|uniref:hypothetical protein n=1 Tax=Paraburkholderia tropica TaxID=92647 RepID=UPI0032B5721B